MRLVGWAIVHSLWQGGVIALVSAALLAATRRSRPNIRYAIALSALSAMLALPVATAMLSARVSGISEAQIPSVAAELPKLSVPAPASTSSAAETVTLPAIGNTAEPMRSTGFDSATISRWVETSLPFLVAAWMIGLLFASGRLINGFARTRSVSRKSAAAASRALELRVEKLCERLGITRAIRILESTSIDVPLVVGALRPVIVVPMSLVTGLTPIQLDMLLAHELAHVRRHDYLINLAQTVLETLLFYHPAARWISERAREERENCCDDIAISACGVEARDYTETLLVLEEARDQGFGLAAAATGGSLLRRAQRLLSGKPSYVELGPRWIAGVITIGAALFAGNDAVAAIKVAYLPAASVTQKRDSTGKNTRADASRAKPSTVITPAISGSLAERWKWAETNSGSSDFWIGYLIAGDQTGKSKFYMSELPVRIDGNVTMSGRMNFGDGDISTFLFIGTPLTPLLGDHDRHSVALFFRIKNGPLGSKVDLVHAGTYTIPGYFANRPLVWLDSATDGESIALVRSLFSRAGDEDTRRDLVSTLGVHQDVRAVAPLLIDLVSSREKDDVRKVAAEWLGRGGDPRGMSVLARTARSDRSEDVRREAIEAFGNMPQAAATDTLIAFVNELDNYDLRENAIESLGERHDPRALSFITTFARSSAPGELRRQAVESIGELEPPSRAFEILREIARTDRDESVRTEAVETIAEVHDPRSVSILAEIANGTQDESVVTEAVESLGETMAPDQAMPLLRQIARKHPLAEARKKALETIIELKDEAIAIDEIVYAVRNDQDESVRKAALEALGDREDPTAMRTLLSFVDGQYPYEIREAALEVYADAADSKASVAMLKQVMSKDRDERLRARAAEILNDQ